MPSTHNNNYRKGIRIVSEPFDAQIYFIPATEGEHLPEGFKHAIIDADGHLNTTQLAKISSEHGDEWWSEDNGAWESSVYKCEPDGIEVQMITKYYSNRQWLEGISQAFPSVRIVLRGDDDCNAYSEYYILEGGNYLRNMVENMPNIQHLNHLAKVWGSDIFQGRWSGHRMDKIEYDDYIGETDFNANIRNVLKSKSVSTAVLADMEKCLTLTAHQKNMLVFHPNYDADFLPDHDWFLGR
jgi:hypothetical protein